MKLNIIIATQYKEKYVLSATFNYLSNDKERSNRYSSREALIEIAEDDLEQFAFELRLINYLGNNIFIPSIKKLEMFNKYFIPAIKNNYPDSSYIYYQLNSTNFYFSNKYNVKEKISIEFSEEDKLKYTELLETSLLLSNKIYQNKEESPIDMII